MGEKRDFGLSGVKAWVSRKTGIPLTRSGRQRKMGKAIGCCVPFMFLGLRIVGGIFDVIYIAS